MNLKLGHGCHSVFQVIVHKVFLRYQCGLVRLSFSTELYLLMNILSRRYVLNFCSRMELIITMISYGDEARRAYLSP